MRKEDCQHFLTWESKPPKDLYPYCDTILWNQTLMEKINNIAALIHKTTMIGGGNKIIAHPSKRELFETLKYYNTQSQRLSGRFNVIFEEDCEYSTIYVYNDTIEDPRRACLKHHVDHTTGLITLTPTFDPEEIEQLKKKYCGFILIKNIFRYGK